MRSGNIIGGALAMLTCSGALGQAKFIPLGDLPGGIYSSDALGISADGLVVVGRSESATGTEGYRWTARSGMVGLGNLKSKGGTSWATAANADGSVIVGSTSTDSGGRPMLWTQATGMIALEDTAGVGWGTAFAVNGDGTVVVGNYGHVMFEPPETFRWTAQEGLVPLGKAFNAYQCNGLGVNADGTVVVGAAGANEYYEAVRWTPGEGWVGLGDLPGYPFSSSAWAVTPDGTVIVGVGNYTKSGETQEAFRWTAESGMVGLGDLPGLSVSSYARAVSADGSVVVGSGTAPNAREAVLWTQASGMVSVRDRLIAWGATGLDKWQLYVATGVSADGLSIAGWGYNASKKQEAWLAILPRQDCLADCDSSNSLDVDDFMCFQKLFALDDPVADCDRSGSLDFDDFLCFQSAFAAGCP